VKVARFEIAIPIFPHQPAMIIGLVTDMAIEGWKILKAETD